ncbi:MAG: MFS transporter, partial [Kiritimatiellae bacterium]|nr:MFS transporter [Kiritimatiellia bacterium]
MKAQPTRAAAQTAVYFAAFVCHGLVVSALGPTLPALAQNTGSRLDQISLLFVTRSLGYLIGSLLGGRLFDRFGGHRIIASVLALSAVLLGGVPVIPALWALAGVMLVLGVSEATLDVGVNTMVIWVHGRRMAPFLNTLHFFFGLGSFLSPIVIAQAMLRTGGIVWGYWSLALLLVPVAGWAACLPSPAIRRPEAEEPARRADVPLVVLVAVFFFLYTGAEISFGGWIYTYALKMGLATTQGAAYLTSAFWGAFTAGRLLSVPAALTVRPQHLLLGGLAGALVSLVAILAWPASGAVLWGGAMAAGLFMSAIFPTTMSLAERRMHITGSITGWFFVGASLGAMCLPALIGQF